MSRAAAGALALMGLLLGACATLAPREDFARVDFEPDQIAERLRRIHALGEARRSVRADGSMKLESRAASGRVRQIILAERPAWLRLESQNLLGQTQTLLVTDGERYSYYDGEQLAGGEVSPFLLLDTLGLDLGIAEAVDALLGAPTTLRGTPHAVFARGLEREVWTEFERLRIGPNGDLLRYTSLDLQGDVRWSVEYQGWKGVSGGRYPDRMVLHFPRAELFADLRLKSVELNAELDRGLFRIPERSGR